MKKRLNIFSVSLNFMRSVYLYYTHQGLASTVTRTLNVTNNFILQFLMNISFGLSSDYLVELFYFGRGNNVLLSAKQKKGLKIGLSRMGGLGDAVITTSMITSLKERWPDSYIYVFVRSKSQKLFLQRDKNIEQVVVVSDKVRLDSFNQIAMAKRLVSRYLDIYFLDRYVVKVFFRKGVQDELNKRLDDAFDFYNLNFYHFPFFSNNLLIYNKNDYELRSACTGLKIEPKGLSFCLSDADCQILKELPASYITVHHGADNEFDAESGGSHRLQTKNWHASRWAEVVSFIKNIGYEVIQLGTSLDEQIPGAIDLRGKTTFTEAGAILKGAVVHLDTEGGLVHLSKALGTKSIVLFGPTAVEFYGYHDNINIRSNVCKNCWWSKPDWAYHCPVGHSVPECMDTIAVEMVTDAITQYLAQYRPHGYNNFYELIDFSLFDSELIGKNSSMLKDIYRRAEIPMRDRFNKGSVNDITGCYIHGSKNWEYLYVVKMINNNRSRREQQAVLDAGSGRGALQVYLSSQEDHRMYSCDYDYNDLSPDKIEYGRAFINTYKDAINFKTCSIFNLPYEDELFGVVYCVSVLEHFTWKKYALRELLRVLKHDGLLILTFDLTSDEHVQILEDDYRVEIPTDSSLRKFLLDELALSVECNQSMLNEAQKNIAAYQIEGIPHYLTVGGICIKKTMLKCAPDRQ
jgi:ADP-heptose:LPS heptosyltransferase/ubiquinone/menaquinone biosynthesis C-methylase UbiE